MHHRWAALALVLALWPFSPKSAAGQAAPQPEQQPRERKGGILGQNYPNPFSTETFIPFQLPCVEGAEGPSVVSLNVYNVLAQLVATPVVQGREEPLTNLKLECGQSYVAHWDGKLLATGKEAAPGVYLYVLEVDGIRSARKLFVAR